MVSMDPVGVPSWRAAEMQHFCMGPDDMVDELWMCSAT
jgi:hypothetical protein